MFRAMRKRRRYFIRYVIGSPVFFRVLLSRKKNGKINRMKRLRFKGSLAPHFFLWLGAAAATLAVMAQTPDLYNEIISHALEHPAVILFAFIPVILLIYLFYAATGTVWLSIALPSLLMFAAAVANKIKVFLRGDPLMPADIILGGEAFNIAAESSIQLGFGTVALLAAIVLCCAALAVFARFHRPRPAVRLICGAAAAALAVICYFSIYTNDAVYESIPIKHNMYNMVNEYNSKGLVLAFTHHIKDLDARGLRPDGYSAELAQNILLKYESGSDSAGSANGGGPAGNLNGSPTSGVNGGVSEDGKNGGGSVGSINGSPTGGVNGGEASSGVKPDVIFLMSEAFWDVAQIPSLIFDGEDGINDPIPVFHSLEKTCATGELFTDVYGGGTDTTEFSVLTGHNIANFNKDISSAYKFLIRKDEDSIVRSFVRNGYSAIAMHPGFPWFYNRQNVYPWLGFEEFIDISAFDEATDRSGNYISDDAMTDKLIDIYNSHAQDVAARDKPLFCFTVSIQNHGPYDAGYMYGETPVNYLTAPGIELSIKSNYAITNYVKGVADADASLARLVGFLEGVGRPVALVFFGDHLPGLGSNFTAYKELGYPIGYDGGLLEKANTYRQRYVIWANDAAKRIWPEYETLKSESRRMSANYLGVYILESLGMKLTPYEQLVCSLRGRIPVRHNLFYGTDGEEGAALYEMNTGGARASDAVTDGINADSDLAAAVGEYKIAQYYKLFDEK